MFLRAGDGRNGLSYPSNHDLSCLVVDAEDQMARFVAKTYTVCSRLVVHVNVLDLGTEVVVDVTGEVCSLSQPSVLNRYSEFTLLKFEILMLFCDKLKGAKMSHTTQTALVQAQ